WVTLFAFLLLPITHVYEDRLVAELLVPSKQVPMKSLQQFLKAGYKIHTLPYYVTDGNVWSALHNDFKREKVVHWLNSSVIRTTYVSEIAMLMGALTKDQKNGLLITSFPGSTMLIRARHRFNFTYTCFDVKQLLNVGLNYDYVSSPLKK